MAQEKTHLFDEPRNVQRLLWVLYAASGLVLALDLVVHRHTKHPWEEMLGFYPLYGFVGCVALVLVAKGMRKLIIRPENYYEQHDLPQHPEREAP